MHQSAAVVDDQNNTIGFAKQCIKICSQDTRNNGVITHRKSKKKEQNNKVKKRFYHFQEFDKIEFQNTKFGKKVLKQEIATESLVTIMFVLMLTWIMVIVQQGGFRTLLEVALIN